MAMDHVSGVTPDMGDAGDDRALAGIAARLFSGFGDPSRVMIVRHLLRGEHRVVELTEHLGLAQSTVSKHLACLLDCGIVRVRTEGRSSLYALAHPVETLELLAAAERFLCLTGESIQLCPGLEAPTGPTSSGRQG